MAEKPKDGEHKEGKKPKKHLEEIRTRVTRDHKGKVTGYVSHHSYKAHPLDHHTEPERPAAVHDTPEEVGEHHTEQWSAGAGAGAGGGGAEAPHDEAAEAAEAGAAGGAAPGPEAGM